MTPIKDTQWACIVIKRQTHTLRHFKQFATRAEAIIEAKMWKDLNQHIVKTHHVYVGRTNGF